MQKNKNVIIVEKDVKVAKGIYLSEGDAFVKTQNGWMLVEAEDGDEDEKDDEEKMDEETDVDIDVDSDDEDDEEEKVEEKKKK